MSNVFFGGVDVNHGEGAPVSMRCGQPKFKEDADLDNVMMEQRDSSRMGGEKLSMGEQVENLQSDMLKSIGTLEGNECGVNDAQANPADQFTPPPEAQDDKLRAMVLAVPAHSFEKPRQGQGSKATLVKMESPQQLSVAGSRVLRSRSKANHEDSFEKIRQGRESKATSVKMEIPRQLSVAGSRTLCSRSKVNREDSCEKLRDSRKSNTTLVKKESSQKLLVAGTRTLRSRSKENHEDNCEKLRRSQKSNATSAKMESSQKLSVAGSRTLRSRSKENHEDCEPSADLETRKGSAGRKGRKQGKEKVGKSCDEFARMRKHLSYLLHRINCEQNLLDAYSSEGWRRQSIEKLRPEKELQRAKVDINRFKLKIRDLFQRLDSMFAEGKFPESLYDADGLIDSEDIFCSKCGSKDLPPGNDILLCDGICDRGFHQNCLNPPLPTEEIPPGDEGWLCPTCDFKVDCYNLLNDAHGTKLTIEDNWEKVFPEAGTTANNELDAIMGLPSDDSEDNEYNPDDVEDDASVEGNESSSDKSDSSDVSFVSEDLGAMCGDEQNLGLPSDDSEDEDFDPDATNVNEDEDELRSSGSDFTSASEDLGAAIGDEATIVQNEPSLPLELEQDLDESLCITSKRCVERLNYKKLYDETYGNAASDSSDDEEWTNMVSTKKENPKKTNGVSSSADGTCGSGVPRRRGQLKVNCEVVIGSPAQLQESSQKTNSAGGSKRRPPSNKLGEAVTKRLYESFKENQYPDRETKEKLANEVGLTFHRLDKWFGHARWNLLHHPFRMEACMKRVLSSGTTPQSVAFNGGGTTVTDDGAALPECGSADTSTKKLKLQRHKTITEGDQSMLKNSVSETTKEGTLEDPLQSSEIPLGTIRRKRRKSGA